jgi:hypothetical protein
MEARVHPHQQVSAGVAEQLRWLVGGFALGFLVPFVFADQLEMQRDLYYGLYMATAVVFFGLWARSTRQSVWAMMTRRWQLTVALGVACAGLLSLIVLQQSATSRPGGLALAAAVVWRGVFYGLADGLLLSSFPILAVFAAFAGSPLGERMRGKVVIGVVALLASMAMTGAYHAGYSDFRSAKVANPLAGDVVWSMPTLITLNPVGAPIAHAGMHVTAVLHSYNTDLFLPPHG